MKKTLKSLLLISLTAMLLIAFLTSCGNKTGDTDGMTSVKYDAENGNLKFTATLTSESLKAYKGKTLYLMEIPAGQSVSDIATSVPSAQMKVKGTMEYSLPLKSGARTLLYSGFVLASYDYAKGYTPIGQVKYVSNAELLAASRFEYPEQASPKGLFAVTAAEAVKTGTKHTVIRVPIEDYIKAKGDDDTVTTVFNGNSYYLSRSELSKLDHKIKTMTDAGIEVMLRFTLDTDPYALDSGVGKLASSYTQGGTAMQGEKLHYAMAVTDPDSFERLTAFFEYVADRYTRENREYGFAGAFIIGDRVNDLESCNADLERTLAETVDIYARVLRVACGALRSKYSEGKIYVSLNGDWTLGETGNTPPTSGDTSPAETSGTGAPGDENGTAQNGDVSENTAMPSAKRLRFGAKEFLSNLAATLKTGGDIPYSVCLTLDGAASADPSNNGDGWTPDIITSDNFSIVNSFLSETPMQWKGERRALAIIASASSSDEMQMARSYAGLYFACLDNDVGVFIYNGQWDNATENGSTGLMTSGAGGHRPEKRKIYDVYCAIDRADSVKVLKELFPELEVTVKKYADRSKGSLHITGEADVMEKRESRTERSPLFSFDGSSCAGFYPAYSASLTEPRGEGSEACLYASLSPLGPGDLMGVRSPELSAEKLLRGRNIKLTLSAAIPSSNTSKVTLYLSQRTENGTLSYSSEVTLQAGNRQTAYFEISKFTAEMDKKAPVSLSVWCEADSNTAPRGDGEDTRGYSLSIYGIELTAKKPISPLVWIIPLAVILGAGAFVFVRFGLPFALSAVENYRENTALEKAEKERKRAAPRGGSRRSSPDAPGGGRMPRSAADGRGHATPPRRESGGASAPRRPRGLAEQGRPQKFGGGEGRRPSGQPGGQSPPRRPR